MEDDAAESVESDGGWDDLVSQIENSQAQPSSAAGLDEAGSEVDECDWEALAQEHIKADELHTPPPASSASLCLNESSKGLTNQKKRGRPFGLTGSHEYRRSLKLKEDPDSSMIKSEKMSRTDSLIKAREARGLKAQLAKPPLNLGPSRSASALALPSSFKDSHSAVGTALQSKLLPLAMESFLSDVEFNAGPASAADVLELFVDDLLKCDPKQKG